ncbi:MAG: hypothetical protein KBD10_02855 [Candidatus Pacebacteria bacterium]|nr:hypothetical protein [Candidatus Paceibacterota bacterium]
MRTGEQLTLEDVRKKMPYLKPAEFQLTKEHDILGFSREELISLAGWKIVGLGDAISICGASGYAFVCMFERLSDNTQAWCQVSFRYVEKYIKTLQ